MQPVEGRDGLLRCDQGRVCCIDEAPDHGRPHTVAPEDCNWCLAFPDAATGVTAVSESA